MGEALISYITLLPMWIKVCVSVWYLCAFIPFICTYVYMLFVSGLQMKEVFADLLVILVMSVLSIIIGPLWLILCNDRCYNKADDFAYWLEDVVKRFGDIVIICSSK